MKGYKKVDEAMQKRPAVYNETLQYVDNQEKNGHAIVIRPSKDLKVDRMEKNRDKLSAMYDLGYQDALEQLPKIKEWLYTKEN